MLQSMGSKRVKYNLATEQQQQLFYQPPLIPTPSAPDNHFSTVCFYEFYSFFFFFEFTHGQRNPEGCSSLGRTESDTTEAA